MRTSFQTAGGVTRAADAILSVIHQLASAITIRLDHGTRKQVTWPQKAQRARVNPRGPEGVGYSFFSNVRRIGLMPRRTWDSCRIIDLLPELVFEVVQEADGGYRAECLTENVFTQADTWDELRKNVVEATAAFFLRRDTAWANSPPPCPRRDLVRRMKIPCGVSGAHLAATLCRRCLVS